MVTTESESLPNLEGVLNTSRAPYIETQKSPSDSSVKYWLFVPLKVRVLEKECRLDFQLVDDAVFAIGAHAAAVLGPDYQLRSFFQQGIHSVEDRTGQDRFTVSYRRSITEVEAMIIYKHTNIAEPGTTVPTPPLVDSLREYFQRYSPVT